jgi:hypothetical protein
MTDDEKETYCERVAIEVEHLPPDEAQAEYERRVREWQEDKWRERDPSSPLSVSARKLMERMKNKELE